MRKSAAKDSEGMLQYAPGDGRRLLNVLLWCIHFLTLANVLSTAAIPSHSPRHLLGSGIAFLVSLAARLFFTFRLERTTAHILAASFILAAMGAAAGNGLHVPGIMSTFVGVAVAGYLLGLRWAGIYGCMSILVIWGAYLLDLIVVRPYHEVPAFAWGEVFAIMLILTCIIVSIPVKGVLHAYGRFQKERRRLSDSISSREERSRRLERDILSRTASLSQANLDLERFPLALAHDMRTPLQALSGFASLLEEDAPTAEQRRSLEELQASVDSLEKLLRQSLERRPQPESSDG